MHIGIRHVTLREIRVCTKSIIVCFFRIVMIVCQRKISGTQTSILPFNSLVCNSITLHKSIYQIMIIVATKFLEAQVYQPFYKNKLKR